MSIYKSAISVSTCFAIDNTLLAQDNLSRFRYDEELEIFVNKFRVLFDRILKENETFIDGANLTGLYTMTGRKNPNYIAQLPSGLTDEFSQEMFIEEIMKANAPLLILGQQPLGYTTQMTGVAHPVRYYKVYEYLYQRYKPLVSIDGKYAIWCYQERYNLYSQIIIDIYGSDYQPITYGYDAISEYGLHNYNLEKLPFLWGNYDEKAAWNNTIIKKLDSIDDILYNVGQIEENERIKGNYLMFDAEWNYNMDGMPVNLSMINVLTGETLYNYTFTPKPGKNRYLIRVSSDYYWYTNIELAVMNMDSNNFRIDNMAILEGD